jgi:hypothetical protein
MGGDILEWRLKCHPALLTVTTAMNRWILAAIEAESDSSQGTWNGKFDHECDK